MYLIVGEIFVCGGGGGGEIDVITRNRWIVYVFGILSIRFLNKCVNGQFFK